MLDIWVEEYSLFCSDFYFHFFLEFFNCVLNLIFLVKSCHFEINFCLCLGIMMAGIKQHILLLVSVEGCYLIQWAQDSNYNYEYL